VDRLLAWLKDYLNAVQFAGGSPNIAVCYLPLIDEDIPNITPLSPTSIEDEYVATNKYNEDRIGPITRAHAKLLEQQVNLLFIEADVLFKENHLFEPEAASSATSWSDAVI
jgi:hypothetical protein